MRTRVGPYHVEGWLGGGGDGTVWAAREPLTGAPVAVKLLHAPPSKGRLARLRREYQYLRALSVPGVPRARRLGVDDDGRVYLAMDRLAGTPSGTWVERLVADAGRVPATLATIAALCARAARLLERVHDAGLLHGDVKPASFLVADDGGVALIDFGAGIPIEDDVLTRPPEEDFYTPQYAAPEVLLRAAPTIASDAFALAATAFRWLTGEPPAGRGSRKELRAAWSSRSAETLARALEAAWMGIDGRVRDAVVAGLALDPAARPALGTWAASLDGVAAEVMTSAASGASGAAARTVTADVSVRGERLVAVLALAAGPLPIRVLARAAGMRSRRVLAALTKLGARVRVHDGCAELVVHDGCAELGVGEVPAPVPGLADALAEALADHALEAPRIRALAAAGRDEEALEACARWVDGLAARGALADAWDLVTALPPSAPSFARQRLQLEARAALGHRAPPSDGLMEALDHARHDRVAGAGAARQRWALARHFGSHGAASEPPSLAFGWQALERGALDLAASLVDNALAEARSLGLAHATADALVLAATVCALRDAPREARRHAARALDHWPPTTPGAGEAVSLYARLACDDAEWSEARRALVAHDPRSPVDRAHVLVALAELELALGHDVVVGEALELAAATVMLDALPTQAALRVRHLVLRVRIAIGRGRVPTALVDEASARLGSLTSAQLPWLVPELGAALVEARLAIGDRVAAAEALAIARDAADVLGDVRSALLVASASARANLAADRSPTVDEALVARTQKTGARWLRATLHRAAGDDVRAWRALVPSLPTLDGGDAHALLLQPWVVKARELASATAKRR